MAAFSRKCAAAIAFVLAKEGRCRGVCSAASNAPPELGLASSSQVLRGHFPKPTRQGGQDCRLLGHQCTLRTAVRHVHTTASMTIFMAAPRVD